MHTEGNLIAKTFKKVVIVVMWMYFRTENGDMKRKVISRIQTPDDVSLGLDKKFGKIWLEAGYQRREKGLKSYSNGMNQEDKGDSSIFGKK